MSGYTRIFVMRSLSWMLMLFISGTKFNQALLSKLYFISFTFSKMSSSLYPLKGGTLDTRMYSITPADQISQV